MKSPIRQCALLLMAFTVWAKPALARSYLNCSTTKVIIVDAPTGNSSVSTEENVGSRMARRLSSGGLMIDGSVLLAAMCLMSWIVKMVI